MKDSIEYYIEIYEDSYNFTSFISESTPLQYSV